MALHVAPCIFLVQLHIVRAEVVGLFVREGAYTAVYGLCRCPVGQVVREAASEAWARGALQGGGYSARGGQSPAPGEPAPTRGRRAARGGAAWRAAGGEA